nr:hypothetical protein [Nonomuraea aurantiaca]
MLPQVGGPQHRPAGEEVVRGHERVQRFQPYEPAGELRRPGPRRVVHPAEGRVDLPTPQSGQRRGQPLPHAQLDPQRRFGRARLTEHPQRGEPLVVDVHAQRLATRPHGVHGPVERGHGVHGPRREPAPGRGQLHAARGPLEQPRPERVLQPADPLQQRLLAEVQPDGRPPKVRLLGGDGEHGPRTCRSVRARACQRR